MIDRSVVFRPRTVFDASGGWAQAIAASSLFCAITSSLHLDHIALAQQKPTTPARGSIVEDRAARKLLEAGDARFDVDEFQKAQEVWQSVIERYPRSRIRYDAHLRLGNYLLERERAYDRARVHFEAVAAETNRNPEQRAEGTLKMGVCFYEAGNFGKTFQVMRDVIEQFPVSEQVNLAYYYIGLGHFQLGHYSRAIEALEKVGTALTNDDTRREKAEAGKRIFVKVEDPDLAALDLGETVKVTLSTTQGDQEQVECLPVGRNVRVVLGSIVSRLGRPQPGNGRLELRGDDQIHVTYIDAHTADQRFDLPRKKAIPVVGDAVVQITDGAFSETLGGVVLGRNVNVQITDADRDLSDKADTVEAVLGVYREKTPAQIEQELAKLATNRQPSNPTNPEALLSEQDEPEIDKYLLVDSVQVTLTESESARQVRLLPLPAAGSTVPTTSRGSQSPGGLIAASGMPEDPAPGSLNLSSEGQGLSALGSGSLGAASGGLAEDGTVHTGVFRAIVPISKSQKVVSGDDVLQALPNDRIRLRYTDSRNTGEGPVEVQASARSLEGNLGGVKVTKADISDAQLRIQTKLKTASALTAIGSRYKEFGLKKNADVKYNEALEVCEEILPEARKLGGRLLEETYVQLWQIYFSMEQLNLAAAMCERLQREFPASGFVDDALLQLAEVNRAQGELQQAIGIFNRLVTMKTSLLRGEAQFGIAECYEQMATDAESAQKAQLFDRSFQEYKKVYERFPESGRVGEAVAKMANYYYQQKDYARAIDVFDSVLQEHPDAKFLDVILFNYGRCLYRLGRKSEARRQFDQLIADFPESPLAPESKKISEALARRGL